jgi:hypothetical protein
MTHLGHFPPFFPHHFHLPRTVPLYAISLHYSQTPPNHHKITTKLPPPAHTHHLRPLHSSPPRFSLSPYSIAFSPNLYNPTFIKQIFCNFCFVLTTARYLYKCVVASGLVFSSFAGVGNFWSLAFTFWFEGCTPPVR